MTGEAAWSLRAACPIPPRISPHTEDVHRWWCGWLDRFGLPLDAAARDRLTAAGFARYAGRLHPTATPADLRTVTALFTWFFLVDDACEATPVRSGVRWLRQLRSGAREILRPGPCNRNSAFDGPLRQLLVAAWREPKRRMPAYWRTRFADAVDDHLAGALTEIGNRTAGREPGVEEYVELRRATSAAYVSYPLVEFTTGRPLPDAVYHHPALRAVGTAGNDLLSWFNDLVSLDRDRAADGGHNLVLAMAREHRVPLHGAVDLVVRRWEARMRQFVDLRAAVPSFGPGLDGAVRAHLDGVADAVRGTIDWSVESARYPTALPVPPP
ncbi:terpene synthase family protein [Micromonospora echinofusca]|uniref:Terpene synthase n=1 Tax=Micromonospora echinofusca TaxID=47858 RepID=A0ABS3VSS7_MICEH|nr:terpene synthase [Micromonospora echinofusca]MBO4207590.1 terpene synthase [Micromonospora echinofusca]